MNPWPNPWEITSGCVSAWRSGAVQRNALPFGAISHLWQLPVYQSAPIDGTSRESMPGACAPSMSIGTPAARHSAASSLTGKMTAVGEVM